MIRLIDNTLTSLDHYMPSKEDLYIFCQLLFTIGVDAVELSAAVYDRMGYLPSEGKFIMNINFADEIEKYPGFYRYTTLYEASAEKLINDVQLNDAREIIKLRALNHCKELRIVGLDDIMCTSYDTVLNEIRYSLPKSIIIFCPENTYSCASALAVEWMLKYNGDVTTSFAGCNNNAATEEVIMAMRLAARHKPNRDLTVLPRLTALFEKITNKSVGNKKPIIGKNIFKVEAGIHADGLNKNPSTYEAYHPSCVGQRSEIVIGKHSGMNAVKMKMKELLLQVPEDVMLERILNLVKAICTQDRKSLNDYEFKRLVIKVIADEGKKIYC